jgi:glycosyltransferase involved in cell wall biosynthesis
MNTGCIDNIKRHEPHAVALEAMRYYIINSGTFPSVYSGKDWTYASIVWLPLARALSKHVSVCIIDPSSHKEHFVIDGVEVIRLPNHIALPKGFGLARYTWNAVTFAWRFFILCLSGETVLDDSVVHFHNGAQMMVFWLLQHIFIRRARVKYVYSLHSPKWMNPSIIPIWQLILAVPTELSCLRNSHLVTFESDVIRRNLSTRGYSPRNWVLLPFGVDTRFFNPQRYNVIAEPKTILYAANIKRQKNQLDVIRAMSKVVDREPTAKLLLVGGVEESAYLKEIEKEVARLDLGQNVIITGPMHIENLNRLRLRSALNLVYSSYTGFDIAVGELFSLGCPTILSSLPTLEGIAENDVNCILVSPDNPDELAGAILRTFGNQDNLSRIGKNARITAEEKLNVEVQANRIISAIESKCT